MGITAGIGRWPQGWLAGRDTESALHPLHSVMASRLPWVSSGPSQTRRPGAGPSSYQQTRFQRRIAEATTTLESWATNPWRRLSLLLIVMLAALVVGGALASISGALAYFDPVSALVAVLLIELAVRLRPNLRTSRRDRLVLQLLDMARMGLFYGLMLDGFKLL